MGIKVEINKSKSDAKSINWDHDGECAHDKSSRSVCEGMYIDKCNDVLGLCAALRAVYAVAGEDPQVRKIVEEAIDEHGGPDAC